MGWKGNNATFGRSWKWFGTLPKNCVSFPSPHEKLPFYFQPSRWIFQKKHSYDHSWTKLLVTYWFCYRTHASRMTFRTLTLAFGWNIMLRWSRSESETLQCQDLFAQYRNHPPPTSLDTQQQTTKHLLLTKLHIADITRLLTATPIVYKGERLPAWI